jgi:hypothetical protein
MCVMTAGTKRLSRTRRPRVQGGSGFALPQLRPPEPQLQLLRVKQIEEFVSRRTELHSDIFTATSCLSIIDLEVVGFSLVVKLNMNRTN